MKIDSLVCASVTQLNHFLSANHRGVYFIFLKSCSAGQFILMNMHLYKTQFLENLSLLSSKILK